MSLLPPRLNYEQARTVGDANFSDIIFHDVALGEDTEGHAVHRSREASR